MLPLNLPNITFKLPHPLSEIILQMNKPTFPTMERRPISFLYLSDKNILFGTKNSFMVDIVPVLGDQPANLFQKRLLPYFLYFIESVAH